MRLTPNVIASRPNGVGRATPFANCRQRALPANRSDRASLPDVISIPPLRISSLPPRAGWMRAGALTRGAEPGGGPSSLVRYADARCAFAPRRVASSETAMKAVSRSAVETARRGSERRLARTAVLPAFAERETGRRSGKLAIDFSIHTQECMWLQA